MIYHVFDNRRIHQSTIIFLSQFCSITRPLFLILGQRPKLDTRNIIEQSRYCFIKIEHTSIKMAFYIWSSEEKIVSVLSHSLVSQMFFTILFELQVNSLSQKLDFSVEIRVEFFIYIKREFTVHVQCLLNLEHILQLS